MQNVTLRMDAELLKTLRYRAVDEGKSLSAWVTDTLRTLVETGMSADKVKEEALAYLEQGFHVGGAPFSREDIYER